MRFIFLVVLLAFISFFKARGQHDSLSHSNKPVLNPVDPKTVSPFLSDPVVKVNRQKFVEDSVAKSYIIPDSSQMKHRLVDSILNLGANAPFFAQQGGAKRSSPGIGGKMRVAREQWVMAVITCLLIYAGLLNIFFGSDLKSIFLSFYAKRSPAQTDKDAALINSWAFIGLFILFCLTLGLLLYQLTRYYHITYAISGIQLFISLTAIIGLLILLKFILLKFIGFIFDIRGVVNEYVAILNLTYFNLAFLLLVVAVCFSLLANRFIPQLLAVSAGLTVIILIWQYLRNSLNIISDFRFHKFYLFVYLCALEICPVLILIKALDR